ncbi:unnamed protein product [Eruca vesicaria subsp. sativa]|uniref:Gamma-glutamylcyclotransferase n=1 Tax=Eruca vesicaria subsp. sativa TaxID=29727 RepID=A0ABC8KJ73_ERUVS|nr:unnamed protein product [Eruca vesicaria subsp. sativa]
MVLWVFGYGSLTLTWNPCFDFDKKLIGYIKTTNASSILLVLIIEERLNILQELARWSNPLELYVFTSTQDKVSNKYYLGPAPLEEIAMQIATGSGPCRNNREYLFKLERAMHDIEHEEEYMTELANEVRKQLNLSKEVKALLKPVVTRVPIKSQSQAHVSTRQRVLAS